MCIGGPANSQTVNISKGGHLFGVAAFIAPALDEVLIKLSGEQHLKGLDAQQFATREGYYVGEINPIHPFRDGNGRTQREFIRELPVQAGFVIDWRRVTREQMMAASLESFKTGESSAMAALIGLSMKQESIAAGSHSLSNPCFSSVIL